MRSASSRIARHALHVVALVTAFAPDACNGPQNAQYVIHIDTDAPLAVEAGGTLGATDARPLFDQLAVGVIGACSSDCNRTFAVDRTMVAGNNMISFGVYSTEEATGGRVDLTLYRAAGTYGASPLANASLEGSISLPRRETQSQPLDVYVQLLVAGIGTSSWLPTSWDSPPNKLSTWSKAFPAPCAGQPREGEVCVPGGPFWMGDMQDVVLSYQRLAVVSPFYLDSKEVTVAEFRRSGLAQVGSSGVSVDPQEYVQGGNLTYEYCDYSVNSKGASADALAVDCVSWTLARKYCQSLGKDLPTRLQTEYVAGALSSQVYPWGIDEPSCLDAVYGRSTSDDGTNSSVCRMADTPLSPAPPGSGLRDRVALAGGTIYDVGCNLGEWAVDYGNTYQPCTTANLLDDFVCNDAKSTGGNHMFKTGAWWEAPWTCRAAAWGSDLPTAQGNGVGFRCARPATP